MLTGPEEIAAAVARLEAGGVVAFPTETVYGLGADALSERAVARVFQLKGRPSNNPLIVHVASAEAARQVFAPGAWSADAELLATAFWPGPLSIVLPKSAAVPSIVTGGGPNVAVRCPDHPTTLALLEAFGGPLVGPSANPSGRVSPTTAAHVREAFSQEDVMVLDGGPCRGGIESTVVSLVGMPRVLRPGLIGAEEIARVIGKPVGNPAVAPGTEGATAGSSATDDTAPDFQPPSSRTATRALESPGLLASHYAPAARTILVDTSRIADAVAAAGGNAAVISWSGVRVAPPHRMVAIASEAAGYAAALYAALREADAMQPTVIVVEQPRATGGEKELAIWGAVMDRLRRASAGR
jgi:L-threonylcarbamoyladenylate synthase